MAIELYVSARTTAFGGGGDPVAGVFCALFDSGGLPVSNDTSDAAGLAYLGVVAAGTYEIRLTAPAGAVLSSASRLALTVAVADTGDLAVDAILDLSTITAPSNPRICRCAGLFTDPAGQPFEGAVLTFTEKALPQLVHNTGTDVMTAILPRIITCVTDSTGYGTVDLLRGAEYAVMVGSMANTTLDIVIPDTATAPLPDVLFPLVDRVEYIPLAGVLTPVSAPTLALAIGGTATIPLETVYRSGYRVAGLSRITLTVADDTIITIELTSDGDLLITGVAAGVETVEVERDDETAGTSVLPATPVRGVLTVTVS
jgi:hypothetical protein